MFTQELGYLYSEFPTGDDLSAREVIIDRATVTEWNLSAQLGTVNNKGIMRFDHNVRLSKRIFRRKDTL